MRIGHGYDVHQLVAGRPLILGGVEIACDRGLLGHSDADVLLHAICDALLGALALGDLGRHFPDTDAAYAGIDSRELLQQVIGKIHTFGYRLVNLDTTILCQNPKLAPHVERMVANIAEDCCCCADQVNVKATTTEKLGFAGRSEGIAAYAVVLLEEDQQKSAARSAVVFS